MEEERLGCALKVEEGQWVLRSPEVAFLTLAGGGALRGWQGVCRALQTRALGRLGLEEPRRAGWGFGDRVSSACSQTQRLFLSLALGPQASH